MEEEDAPVARDDLPTEHKVQVVDPGLDAYLPGSQEIQVFSSLAPTAMEYLPEAHCKQEASLAAAY